MSSRKLWVAVSLSLLSLPLIHWGCGKPPQTSVDAPATEGDPIPEESPDEEPTPVELPPEEQKIRVEGTAAFGTQCPYGMMTDPSPTQDIGLWDCPIGVDPLQLSHPMRAWLFQADCKERIIHIRSLDQQVDTAWEVMPDGSFYIANMNGGRAVLARDGSGNANCSTPTTAEFWGQLICHDRDKVELEINTLWWLDKVPPPSPYGSPAPSPVPSVTPSPSPTRTTSPSPSPTVSPSPAPIVSPTVRPSPSPFPRVTISPIPLMRSIESMLTSETQCKLPAGCYMHTRFKLRQCM